MLANAPLARDLLAEIVGFQTNPPQRQAGHDILTNAKKRLAHPSADPLSDERACYALLYSIWGECRARFGIRDFPAQNDHVPPLSEAGQELFKRLDALLAAVGSPECLDNTKQNDEVKRAKKN